jgi:hypothetical protein
VTPHKDLPLFEYRSRLCWGGCRNIRIIELFPHNPEYPDVIEDKLKWFFGTEFPADLGRAKVPPGNLKMLADSETLKGLSQDKK